MENKYAQYVVSKTKPLVKVALLGVVLFSTCSSAHSLLKERKALGFSPQLEGARFEPELKRELDPEYKKELRIIDLLSPSLNKVRRARFSGNANKNKVLREVALEEVCAALAMIKDERLDVGLASSVVRGNLGEDLEHKVPCKL